MKSKSLIFLLVFSFSVITDAKQPISSESIKSKALSQLESDLDEAEETISKALELYPDDPEVYFICGRIMGRQAEDAFLAALSYANKSLNCLKKAVDLAQDNVRYRRGLLNFYIGAPSIAGGDVELAWTQVQKIYELDEKEGTKAEIKYLQGTEQEKALEARLLEMQADFPNDPEINLRLGLVAQEDERYEEAFTAFTAATQSPDNSTHYLNALYQLGRNAVFSNAHLQEGINGLLAYVEKFDENKNIPPVEWAFLRLAQLYDLLLKQEQVTHYSALAAKSDDRELHRALRKLQEKRG